MRVINFIYKNNDDLIDQLSPLAIESNILIQIFFGISDDIDEDKIVANNLIQTCATILPNAHIMLTSSALNIMDGEVYAKETTISVSVFQTTSIKSLGFRAESSDQIAEQITRNLISDDTKLLLFFISSLHFNATPLINKLSDMSPQIIIAGGGAAIKNLDSPNAFIGTKEGVDDFVVVCASLDSQQLQVYNDFVFGWSKIGVEMIITDSKPGGIVNTINNIPAQEVYRRYLGDEVADKLPSSALEFPLIISENGIFIGRSVVALLDNGGVQFSVDIEVGTKVTFGVGSIHHIKEQITSLLPTLEQKNPEAIYTYSCITRYLYFKDNILDYETKSFNNIAPTAGFFTYGEYYHKNGNNYILNTANTFIALSEGTNEQKNNTQKEINDYHNSSNLVIQGLINLSHTANNDYNEMIAIFKQYKHILEESTIVLYLDTNGIIIHINKNFFDVSQFNKNSIIGKNLSTIIDEDSSVDMRMILDSVKKIGYWNGILKNRTANNAVFYTKTTIRQILNHNNEVMMLICTMDDITEYETKKQNLETSINAIAEVAIQKDDLISHYQTLLDKSAAIIKTKRERLIEVNKTCEKLFGYDSGEMIGMHLSKMIDPNSDIAKNFYSLKNYLQKTGYLKLYVPCIRKDGTKLHCQVYMMEIAQCENGNEFIVVLHDNTSLFNTQKELTDIQKEVIYAMGAISEGKSRETGNHIRRVAEYSYLLAKLYGLDEQDAELIRTASPMHDIGKLTIPDTVLNKPGKLTDEEFEIIKTHAQKGYDMLCFSDREILKTSAQIALTHHEWWNGNGYPNKLKAEEIPLVGRITAVADVFDALSNDRCYKKAWPIEEVIAYMVKNKNIQFEGKLIDILVDNLDKFIQIKNTFEDKF